MFLDLIVYPFRMVFEISTLTKEGSGIRNNEIKYFFGSRRKISYQVEFIKFDTNPRNLERSLNIRGL